ncbi:tRNA lysidine(34) synthetase TilS [Nonlabens spongiae]|uniref:tRNA(Ile)-lysidine synthase n=1 Tax=Nonlabens spongiae TaxID=331648 RepID=A0A1W6MHX8_9FLAO|nr:tRNA lysidine(34) synthetase TilS [Nonlabens spongiae]ARN77224.1 tRNA lysidine(34) synthetase TilS [Nonlabens spongiae]
MIEVFKKHIKDHFSEQMNAKIGLAISGGLDSVVLAHLLKTAGADLTFIHVNFNLRGTESDDDEKFVSDLARSWNVEFHSKSVETKQYAHDRKMSTQMAARELRYAFFKELVQNKTVDFVATAHHLDDQLETFLINLGRGSGLQGLTGIPKKNNHIFRPLLPFTREQILIFAKSQNINWREDSSNASKDYQRNALRHDVIPELKKHMPQLMDNFQESLEYLDAANNLVELELSRFRESVITLKNGRQYLNISELKKYPETQTFLHYLLRETGISAIEAIKLLNSESGKSLDSSSHNLLRDREHLILSEKSKDNPVDLTINKLGTHELTSGRLLEVILLKTTDWKKTIAEESAPNVLLLDADLMSFPFQLRTWQNGDKINPLGMRGYQKVSDILINHKIPLIDKQNFLVLRSGEELLWLAGLKSSDRFKVTSRTTQILKFRLQ